MNISIPGLPRRPVILIILDGFGTNPGKLNNAIAIADTPRFDDYFSRATHTLLQASGHAVGLPDGQMGNSEVGHLTLGCGSIVRQDLVRIDDAIADRSFFSNKVWLSAIKGAATAGQPVHLWGLVSDGGVHSHLTHLLALLELCHLHGARPLVHIITDGRDTPPQSALAYIEAVENGARAAGGAIATLMGRYYAMDRDQRWERTECAWRALVEGKGRRVSSARAAIESAYAIGENDEFIKPCILPGWEPLSGEEAFISFNFRKDRPRQLVAALSDPAFKGFDRGAKPPQISVTCMMRYDRASPLPFAFHHEAPAITLSQLISEAGLKQLHCAETEKFAHVTYFFNCAHSELRAGEEHILIPSPKVATYDLKPEMSAPEVAAKVVEAIESGTFAFILVNFANGDMVGHTAVREAVIKAVETLDLEVGRVLDAAVAHGYSVILTADHGNCEEMVDPTTGTPHTQHTTYPVPCLIIDQQDWQLSTSGGLSNIAPTVLQLLGLPKPAGMTANSLLLQSRAESAVPQPYQGAA